MQTPLILPRQDMGQVVACGPVWVLSEWGRRSVSEKSGNPTRLAGHLLFYSWQNTMIFQIRSGPLWPEISQPCLIFEGIHSSSCAHPPLSPASVSALGPLGCIICGVWDFLTWGVLLGHPL